METVSCGCRVVLGADVGNCATDDRDNVVDLGRFDSWAWRFGRAGSSGFTATDPLMAFLQPQSELQRRIGASTAKPPARSQTRLMEERFRARGR